MKFFFKSLPLLLLLTRTVPGSEVASLWEAAKGALEDKNYISARLLLNEILEKEPFGEYGDKARYFLGLAYYYEKDYKEALYSFEILLRDYPGTSYAPDARFWIGKIWFHLHNTEKALRFTRLFLQKYPQHKKAPYALLLLGRIYESLNQPEAALRTYHDVLEKYPSTDHSVQAGMRLGLLYYSQKNYRMALRYFEKVRGHETDSITASIALFRIMRCYFELKDYATALKMIHQIDTLFPSNDFPDYLRYYEALITLRQGKVPEAKTLFHLFLRKFPGSALRPKVFFQLGKIYEAEELYSRAADHFYAIIKDHKDDPLFEQASAEYVFSLARASDLKRGIDEILKILGDDPSNLSGSVKHSLYFLLGELYLRSRQYREAASAYRESLKAASTAEQKEKTRLMLIQALTYAGKPQAEKELKTWLEAFPDSKRKPDAYFMAGQYFLEQKKPEKALLYFQKIIRFFPKYLRVAEAYAGTADAYRQLERYPQAIENYLSAIKLSKDIKEHGNWLLALAECYYKSGLLPESLQILKKASADSFPAPVREDASFNAALILYRMQKYADSASEWSDFMRRFPASKKQKQALLYRAWCYYHLEQYGKAALEFQRVYEHSPKDKSRFEALLLAARSRAMLGETKKAQKMVQEIVAAQAPNEVRLEALYLSGSLYIQDKNPEAVRPVIEQIKVLSSDSPYIAELLKKTADLYHEMGQQKRAEKIYDEILEGEYDIDAKVEVLKTKASRLVAEKKLSEAMDIYENLLLLKDKRLTPYHPVLIRDLWNLYEQSGEWKRSLPILSNLQKRRARNPELQQATAVAEFQTNLGLNQIKKARRTLGKLRRLKLPGDKWQFYSGLLYFRQKEYKKALAYFERNRQTISLDSEIGLKNLYYAALSWYNLKSFSKALPLFVQIVYSGSTNAALHEAAIYYAAECVKVIKGENSPERQNFLQKLRSEYPDSAFLKKNK